MFKIENPSVIANGTVMKMGIRFEDPEPADLDATRGRTNPKVYDYALIKAGGLWYVSGSGKVPQAATWGAVRRWLARDGRVVAYVQVMTDSVEIYREPIDGELVPLELAS